MIPGGALRQGEMDLHSRRTRLDRHDRPLAGTEKLHPQFGAPRSNFSASRPSRYWTRNLQRCCTSSGAVASAGGGALPASPGSVLLRDFPWIGLLTY